MRTVAFIASMILLVPAVTAYADSPCPAGQMPFKDVQKNLLANGADILNGDFKCAFQQKIDSIILSGGCANPTEAKDFLRQRTNNKPSIDGLNPEFACKLMNFIKEAPGNITIGVGTYQITASVATHGIAYCQHYQCKEGTNTHPLGCAADLIYDGRCNNTASCLANPCAGIPSCKWAHENAEAKGLQYRLMPTHPRFPGYTEPWHIELKDGDLTRCQGGQVTPTLPGTTPATPLGGAVGNSLRDLFGAQQQQPQYPPLAAQPLPTTQSPISAFQPPVAQMIPTSGSPVTTGAPNASSDTSGGSGSIADKLAALIEETSVATSTVSATSGIPIIVTAEDSKTVTSSKQPDEKPTATVNGSGLPQQTFTTEDLSAIPLPSQQTSSFVQILMRIRDALLKLLAYLQPFRSHVPQSQEAHLM